MTYLVFQKRVVRTQLEIYIFICIGYSHMNTELGNPIMYVLRVCFMSKLRLNVILGTKNN
jgi:hypothetical protein